MSNPRGPMAPFELRSRLERTNSLRAYASCIHNLANIYINPTLFPSYIEEAVIQAEKAIKEISIVVKLIKEETSP